MSHKIQSIPAVTEYFGADELPIITQVFTPRSGWRRTGFNKRVSRAWLRKLRAEGVTHVTLLSFATGRQADFSIEELLKIDRRPLLPGRVI